MPTHDLSVLARDRRSSKHCAGAAIAQQRPSHKLAPDYRFARPDVPELTIESPRTQASRRARPDVRIALMMRRPDPTTLTAAVALLL